MTSGILFDTLKIFDLRTDHACCSEVGTAFVHEREPEPSRGQASVTSRVQSERHGAMSSPGSAPGPMRIAQLKHQTQPCLCAFSLDRKSCPGPGAQAQEATRRPGQNPLETLQ